MEDGKQLVDIIKVKCGEETEYTGFIDRDGVKIYVGDIVREVNLKEV